ncbi:MAG: methyltransferase domain-containing protein [Candidatus Paceibacterota bacterium]
MFSDPENNIRQLSLVDGMHVADFGSGSGFYSLAIAKAVAPTGRVFAVDIQKDLLQKLKNGAKQSHLNNVDIIWGDLEHLGGTKLRENSMDAVVVANLFFQIQNKDGLCLEIKRVLKPKARVLVVDWSASFGGIGPQENDVVPKINMTTLFHDHGFTLDREIAAGAEHYGLVFRKN